MRKILTAVMGMCFGMLSVSHGQEVKVAASLEKDSILIGDQIRFRLLVEQEKNQAVAFPLLTDTLTEGVEIIQMYPADSLVLENGRVRIQKEYSITAFDSGRYEIHPVAFQYEEGKEWKQAFTDYAYLTVLRVDIAPADTSLQYFDIKAPYSAPVSFREILPWGILVLLILLISWFLYRYFKARKEGKPLVRKEAPPEPAHVLAFRQLEQIKEKKLWQQDMLKAYYTEMTDALRHYVYRQYGVQSPEQTSSETLELLKERNCIPVELWQTLSEILLSADLVKFAKSRPQPSAHVESWEKAWLFVEQTYTLLQKEEEKREEKVIAETGEKGGEA